MSAEQYALGCLRRHRDAMSRPDFQAIADDSALSAKEVEAMWEQLLAGRTPKPLDRPRAAAAPSPPGQNADPRPVEAPESWLRAKDHPSVRIRNKYKRATAAIADLEAALAKESEKDKLREKEARLAAALAKVRAEIRGGVPTMRDPKPADDVERITCDCGDMVRADRIAQHRNRSSKHQAVAS